MKKILFLLLGLVMSGTASAETIIVINDSGTVTSTVNTTAPVVETQPVTVVRETSATNNYYYDSGATEAAVLAGITTAAVGTVLFNGGRHHDKAPAPARIAPHGGKGGTPGFKGGHAGGGRGPRH